jgi:hypothetical protein
MSTTYTAVTLAERPVADIIPGQTFKLETRQVPKEADLKDGEVIFESNYLSLDPAMRGWLDGKIPDSDDGHLIRSPRYFLPGFTHHQIGSLIALLSCF